MPAPRQPLPPNPDPDRLRWCRGHERYENRDGFASAGKKDGSLRGRCKEWEKPGKAVYDARRQVEHGARLNAAREQRRTPDQEASRKRRRRDRELTADSGVSVDPMVVLGVRLGEAMVCFYCDTSTVYGHGTGAVDHVVPTTDGGVTAWGNLVPACWRCNSSKESRTLTEWVRVLTAASLLPATGALPRLAAGASLPELLEEAGWSSPRV